MTARQSNLPHASFLLGIVILLLVGCTKSELNGNVYLTYGAGDVKPVAGTEVYLWPGTEKDLIDSVGLGFSEWADGYLISRNSAHRDSESADLGKQLEKINERLTEISGNYEWASPDTTHSCEIVGAEEWARISGDASKSVDVRAIIKEHEADVESSNQRIASLRRNLAARKSTRLQELKAEYIRDHIRLQDMGKRISLSDDKYIKFTNTGNLAIRSVRTSLAINGTVLFDVGQGLYWSYHGDTNFIDSGRNNEYREYPAGLGPNESWAVVFSFFPDQLGGDELHALQELGFTKQQYANAKVVVADVELTSQLARQRTDPLYPEFPSEELKDTFANELAATNFAEEEEIRSIRADVATKKKKYEPLKALLADCDQLAELRAEKDDIERHAAALNANAGGGVAAEDKIALATSIALRPHEQESFVRRLMVEKIREMGGDAEYWSSGEDSGDAALREIFARLMSSAKTARSDISGAFAFLEIDRGNYVLVAGTSANDEDDVWWFVPVEVSGPTTQELANFNLMEGPLVQQLATLVIGHLQGPEGEAAAD